MKKKIALLLCALLAVSGLAGCSKAPAIETVSTTAAAAEPTEPAETWGRTVQRNGHTWRYNSRLTTVLFLGIDTHVDGVESGVEYAEGYGNDNRADTIGMLVLNPETETVTAVMMSRDTMAEVDLYTPEQIYMTSGIIQIAMQYTVGDNAVRSNLLMKRAVSRALLDLPITATCSMTLDSIGTAVDFLGGLTLTLEDDWTDIDPRFTPGATVTLNAAEVESFLRYRDKETVGSNDQRMNRHGWFIRQMFAQISKIGSTSIDTLLKLLDKYMQTDMDAETLRALTKYKFDSTIRYIPGQTVLGYGGLHDEFYIDEEAMKDLLLDVFYVQAD